MIILLYYPVINPSTRTIFTLFNAFDGNAENWHIPQDSNL